MPRLFQQAGYHTSNGNYYPVMKEGKTDCNFEFDPGIDNGTDWKTRKTDQPFFAQTQHPDVATDCAIESIRKQKASAKRCDGNRETIARINQRRYRPGTVPPPNPAVTNPPVKSCFLPETR